MPSINYPASLDDNTTLPGATVGTDTTAAVPHNTNHNNANAAIKALEAKLGTGADVPTVGDVLMCQSNGQSAWVPLVPASALTVSGVQSVTGPKTFQPGSLFDLGKPVYSVKDYGAVGDNLTDDGNAINAAITAAGVGGQVYFPGATYYSTKRHVPVSGQTWYGDGIGVTTIRASRTFDYSVYYSGSSSAVLTNFTIRDMTLNANNVANASCMQWYYADFCTAERVEFKNVVNGWSAKLGVSNGDTETYINNTNRFIDCLFGSCSGSLEQLLIFNSRNTEVTSPEFTAKTGGNAIGLWQKCYNTHIDDAFFHDMTGGGIYYSITVENTYITNPYFENVGSAILGSNISDYGSFGLTQAKNLYISSPQLVGGVNSINATGIQLGAVDNVHVISPKIRGYLIGIGINNGNNGNTAACTNFSITDPQIYNNNASANVHLLHPGIFFSGVGGSLYGTIFGGNLYDNQGTKAQRYPIVFDGPFIWDNIQIISNRLLADTANGAVSVAIADGAALGADVLIANNQDYSTSGSHPVQKFKVLNSAVTALTDGATINTNAALGNEFTVTLGGNRTIANPTNPTDGQRMIVRLKQDATGSRTVTWGSQFRFSGGVAPTLTTTANKTDYLEFVYNSTDTKWDLILFLNNF